MKMKNLKLYIPVIALLSLVACKKSFLDTEDVKTATEQNFYKTPSDAFKALVGIYDDCNVQVLRVLDYLLFPPK
jgi:hypothetical protein